MPGKVLHAIAAITIGLSLQLQLSLAAPVGLRDAERAGIAFALSQGPRFSGPALAEATCETTPITDPATGEILAYAIGLPRGGFVVASADTRIKPIIAYSLTGSFPADPNNALLQMLRVDLQLRLAANPFRHEDVRTANEAEWAQYGADPPTEVLRQTGDVIVSAADAVIQYPPDKDGWLTTAWAQTGIYNDLCPIDPATGQQCLTGCVATAMAQVINYWQHPICILFSSDDDYTSSIDPGDGYGTRAIPIAASDASFLNIRYGHLSDDDIARAMFACGVAVKTNYSSGLSSAYSALNLQPAFENMGYSCSPPISGYFPMVLLIKLRLNMENGQPAILAIKNGGSGEHVIICDGYRDDNTYHLNFGWGASTPPITEAWYSLPDDLPFGYYVIEHGIVDIIAPEKLPGDINSDCVVNVLDLIFLRNRLGRDPNSGDNWRADVTQDGQINVLDVIFVRNHFNTTCK